MGQKINKNIVYSTIRQEILDMDLLPGQVISEIEISKRFSVSRTPVRQAFQRLEYEGLLEIKSHLGTYVTLIDLNQINDIRFMREQIELEIIRLLVHQENNNIELKLRMILDEQGKLFSSDIDDLELAKKFMKSDNEFHKTLFESANKLGVWNYLMSIEHHYERLRMFLNIYDKEYLFALYEDHQEFYDNIVNGQWDKIQERYKDHLKKGIERGTDFIVQNSDYFTEF